METRQGAKLVESDEAKGGPEGPRGQTTKGRRSFLHQCMEIKTERCTKLSDVAHMVEQLTSNQWVMGSIPIICATKAQAIARVQVARFTVARMQMEARVEVSTLKVATKMTWDRFCCASIRPSQASYAGGELNLLHNLLSVTLRASRSTSGIERPDQWRISHPLRLRRNPTRWLAP